ncbi:MAG TPA: hypothetical protein ACFYD2_08390 [Candidatus Avalokitesvara rifleensis]|uniref:hypothetical protein n=1 Tax=Candidatus Avalokitesvara rifleensis TaxID=3367620 RepID=UPI0027123296|nr:hypothetical protein [Candidatus Brocadiales bacterium]
MKEINYLILKEQKVKCGMIGTDFLMPPSLEGKGQGKGECVICPGLFRTDSMYQGLIITPTRAGGASDFDVTSPSPVKGEGIRARSYKQIN